MATSKVERLVNLVIALLSTRGFITADKIRSSVAGYSESPSAEAFSRMFERDKNELRDLGIPLEAGRVSALDPTEGYRINRDAYALPPVELTPDEAAAVAVATQLWESPELITATQGALLKLRAAGVDVDPLEAGARWPSPLRPGCRACAGQKMFWGSCCRPSIPGRRCSSRTGHRGPSLTPNAPSSRGAWSPSGAAGIWWATTATATPPAIFRLSRIGAEVTAVGPTGAQSPCPTTSICAGSWPRRRSAERHLPAAAPTVWVADGRATALRRAGRSAGRAAIGRPRRRGDRTRHRSVDRLARDIAGYGADAVVLEPRVPARRCAGPAARRTRGSGAMTPVSTRLVRLLNMVPYFQANPRITRAEAAAELGVSASSWKQDLNQLWMCGLPGYCPGDLIDFEFSGDTIEVTFSAGIDRPLKLTSPEATGLLVALRALADIPGVVDPAAARSAIAKIEAAAGAVGQDATRLGGRPSTNRRPSKAGAAAAVRAAVQRQTCAGHRLLLRLARHADQPDRRPHPGAAGRRPQLSGGLVARSRRGSAVPVRPHRGRHRAGRAGRPTRTGAQGATGHVAVRRRPGAAVGDTAGGALGVVDVRVLPDARAARAARRIVRGGHDVCLRRLDDPAGAGLRF